MKEFIFTWHIENIGYSWHETGINITSPVFQASTLQNTAWTLRLYPRGISNWDFLSLYLCREKDEGPNNFEINFELSCISADKSVLNSSFHWGIFNSILNVGEIIIGNSCLKKRYEVFDRRKSIYLPQDTLILQCKMWRNEIDTNESEETFARTRLITEKIISITNIILNYERKETFHIKSKTLKRLLMSVKVYYVDGRLNAEINPIIKEEMKCTFKLCFVNLRTGTKFYKHVSSLFGEPQKQVWLLPCLDNALLTENGNPETPDFEFTIETIYSTGEVQSTIEQENPNKISEYISHYIHGCSSGCKMTHSLNIFTDLWNLYVEKVFCDVELKTQTKSFFVHKVVLCARSPVFLAMLTGEMKENMKGCIEILDISDSALEIFLKFLYTDLFEVFAYDAVIELYYAADKYQVERLKHFCCSYLLGNVDADNICELLILADRHNDRQLKWKLDGFIWENEEKVYRCSTWKKFACEQPQLVLQTMLSKYEEKENYDFDETYEDRLSSIPNIKDDFRSVFQGRIASDVVVKSEGSRFPAHKAVLSASSPTFRETFKNDLKDKCVDFLKMENWDDDTVSQMLSFLYTDSLGDIQWHAAMKLYQLANSFEMRNLRMKCSCFLLENLSVTDASDLLLFSNEHQDVRLKAAVEDFIIMHDEEIFPSDEWSHFSKEDLLLANETMIAKYKK